MATLEPISDEEILGAVKLRNDLALEYMAQGQDEESATRSAEVRLMVTGYRYAVEKTAEFMTDAVEQFLGEQFLGEQG